jgi:hypothetical protein
MPTTTPDSGNAIFQMAEEFVNQTSQHVFLTGKAGTGKTTFLRHIVKATHKRAVVAAPTGVAAINAGGVTLHSLFQLSFEPFLPNGAKKEEYTHFSKAKLDVIQNMELLIIDEVSMLRADTLDAIDDTMRRVRRTAKPFGGVQVLYIGDMFQLPPVVKNDEWSLLKAYYETPFFFHAKCIAQQPPLYLELKNVYRQRDQTFVDLLNRVRNNLLEKADIDELNKRYIPNFCAPKNEKYITLTTHNYQADKINDEELKKLGGKMYEFKGDTEGDFPDYTLPTDMVMQLKEGAQIMFIKNDQGEQRRYYNGKIGTISRISFDQIFVQPVDSDREIELNKETWRNYRYTLNKKSGALEEEILGTFTQYPIRLAWAITVHKSQGLTFEKVILDISRAFAAGQAYVALSRCTTLEGIVLQSPVRQDCVQTDEYAIRLAQSEKSAVELSDILKAEKQKFWAMRLLLYFDWKPLHRTLYELQKLLENKTGEEFDDARKLLYSLKSCARSQENVLVKFRLQLQQLTRQAEQSGDTTPLAERCQKAVEYFFKDIVEKMLLPLRENISSFNGKKAKTYLKNLCALEESVVMFLEELKKVRYNDVPLVNGAALSVPPRQNLFEAAAEKQSRSKKPKPAKGESARASLELHKAGCTPAEIAQERNLNVSTISSHLQQFIASGEVSVFDLVEKEKVEAILPHVSSAVSGEQKSSTAILQELGEGYTYDDIRAVARHWAWTKGKA